MDGRRNEIETSAATLAEIARGYISDKLPTGGKLAPLVLKMVNTRWRGTKFIFGLAAAIAAVACTTLDAILGEGRAPGLGGGRGLGTSFETAFFRLDVDAVGAGVGPTRGAGWGLGS
jgi:hypothetical protein